MITEAVFGAQAQHFVSFSESTLEYWENNKVDVTKEVKTSFEAWFIKGDTKNRIENDQKTEEHK